MSELPSIDLEEMNDEAKARFRVDNLSKAEWAMEYLMMYRMRMEENQAIVRDRVALLEERKQSLYDWLKDENGKIERNNCQFFEAQLVRFHQEIYDAEENEKKKRKTIPLPSGKLVRSPETRSVDITDEKSFIDWATKEADIFVRIGEPKVSPAKDEIKKAIKDGTLIEKDGQLYLNESGEGVPGATIEVKEVQWKVEPI